MSTKKKNFRRPATLLHLIKNTALALVAGATLSVSTGCMDVTHMEDYSGYCQNSVPRETGPRRGYEVHTEDQKKIFAIQNEVSDQIGKNIVDIRNLYRTGRHLPFDTYIQSAPYNHYGDGLVFLRVNPKEERELLPIAVDSATGLAVQCQRTRSYYSENPLTSQDSIFCVMAFTHITESGVVAEVKRNKYGNAVSWNPFSVSGGSINTQRPTDKDLEKRMFDTDRSFDKDLFHISGKGCLLTLAYDRTLTCTSDDICGPWLQYWLPEINRLFDDLKQMYGVHTLTGSELKKQRGK